MTTTTSPLDHALAYAARGWRVVPIRPGGKHPADVPRWQEAATTDVELIGEWWRRWPAHGVGIATGRSSGLWVLDVDVSGDKRGDETLADLVATYGPLPDTVEVVTGSGGRHLYFAWPDDAEIRNDQAGRLGPGLDVRGEGGQVLAPPTIHPNGTPYAWEASGDPFDGIAVARAPAWLVELLTSTTTSTPRAERSAYTGEPRPGDVFAAAVTWPELLVADGATFLGERVDHRSGTRYEIWARPGADHTSATLYYGGTDLLKVHSTSWPSLREGQTYTKFGFFVAVRYGGDFARATRELAARQAQGDLAEWVGETAELCREDAPTDVTPWPTPRALEEQAPPPDFPVEVLPPWMADHCLAAADRLQVPVDLCAQIAIGVLASVCMGKLQVQVTASWREHVNVYLATAMHSGAGKSPADKAMAGVLRRWEAELRDATERLRNEAEANRKVAERELRKAEKSGDAHEVVLAMAGLEDVDVPPEPRILADDATPEALTMLLARHDGRLAVVSSEAELLDVVCGAYASNKRVNLNVYLKAWSGDPILIDRKGGNGKGPEHYRIPEALLTVAVSVQPSALAALAEHPELAGRGFLARFMYSLPTPLRGRRDRHRARLGADLTTTAAYEDGILDIARQLRSWQMPASIRMADDAIDLFLDWLQDQERELDDGGRLAPIAEWVAKMQGTVARLAALLHVAEGGKVGLDARIGADTVRRAIAVGEYWMAHAHAVAAIWLPSTGSVVAAHVLKWIGRRDDPTATFTVRDAHRGTLGTLRGRIDGVDDVREALQQLADDGWVRTIDGEPVRAGQRGRPSQCLEASPWTRDMRDMGPLVAQPVTVSDPHVAHVALSRGSGFHSSSSSLSPHPTTRQRDMSDMSDDAYGGLL
jgi:replicative DNA helicase